VTPIWPVRECPYNIMTKALSEGNRHNERLLSAGLSPERIECARRLDLTEIKLRASAYHVEHLVECADGEPLRFELNSLAFELLGAWDLLRHEIAVDYCFYPRWKPKFSRQDFWALLEQSDRDLTELVREITREPWYRALRGFRNYVTHQGVLLTQVHIRLGSQSEVTSELMDSGDLGDDFLLPEHNGASHIRSQGLSYFQHVVLAVDRVRLHCLAKAPLFVGC
jgi:hypothetical protein